MSDQPVIRPSKERNILDLAKNLQDELHVYCKGAAGSGDNFYARTFANLADRADELVKLLESAPETGACGCPEVCKVCGGRANSCALLGHRPEADRSVKWHECKANAQKAFEQCSRCGGSGYALNIAGEPDDCPACRGDTVAPSESEGESR